MCFYVSMTLTLSLILSDILSYYWENLCVVPKQKAIPQMLLQCNIQQNSMLSLFNSIKMVHKVGIPWESYQFVKISRQEIIVKSKLIKLNFIFHENEYENEKKFPEMSEFFSFKWKIIKIIFEELIKNFMNNSWISSYLWTI